jgi:hypothetical protein
VEAVLNQPTNDDLLGMRNTGEAFSVLPTV